MARKKKKKKGSNNIGTVVWMTVEEPGAKVCQKGNS